MSVTKILIVDDSSTTRSIISKYIGDSYLTLHAGDGEEAWRHINDDANIALVFADMRMPVMNGMLLLKKIRDCDDTRISNLPVIMITGHEDSEAAKQASFNMGATDFISKPFSAIDIISRAKSYTQLNLKIAELEQNVTHESVTGLLNEQGFREIADKAIAAAFRHKLELSMLAIKIKNIEPIINKYDGKIVDQIIKNIAANLQQALRKEEVLAYDGSGHFSVLLPMTKVFKAHIVGLRFQSAISKIAFEIDSKKITVELAIGITSTEENNANVRLEDLKNQAAEALTASLQRPNCKVMRYDELNLKELNDQKVAATAIKLKTTNLSAVNVPADIDIVTTGDKSDSDFGIYHSYLADILQGKFEHIPKDKIATLVKPLETFLSYANEQGRFGASLPVKA